MAVLLALWVFVQGATLYAPKSVTGTQCPTASIHEIVVAIESCCGKIVRFETRAPRIGEKGFVQCRCAEKKASESSSITAPPMLVLNAPAPLTLDLPIPPTLKDPVIPYVRAIPTHVIPPPLRPPTA